MKLAIKTITVVGNGVGERYRELPEFVHTNVWAFVGKYAITVVLLILIPI
jgi:hypothetical protein